MLGCAVTGQDGRVLRVVSANLNGVRASLRRGGLAWLTAQDADVLCLQEVRASDDQLREALNAGGFAGRHVAHAPSVKLGHAGVAVVSRRPLDAVRVGVGRREFADTGRWVEGDVGGITFVSVYVPKGEAGTPRQQPKMRFLAAMTRRMATLRYVASRGGPPAVVCGDVNVAHREIDLKNWRGNMTHSGFLPEERAVLDRWLGPRGGWVDVARSLAGDVPGPYTWWSWRGTHFDADSGWRIDYQLATKRLAALAVSARVGRAETYAARWSDHAAVVVDYDT
jgi:exodeoxyribonuclease III